MNKFLLFLLILPLAAPWATAQKEDTDKLFDDGEFFYSTGEYKEAAFLFAKLVNMDPENANYNYLAGASFLKVKGEERKAIPYLEKAVENTTLKYKDRNPNIHRAPWHAWFFLGNAYRINNQLDEALDAYTRFMDLRDFEKKYNLRIVQNELKAVERAKIIQDSPLNLIREKISLAVDDGTTTFRPVVSINENSMVFMKSLKFYDAIMYTWKIDGQWVEPVNITPQVGSDGDMVPSALSADGTELLLVKTSESGDGDIYLSRLNGQTWSKAGKMNKNVNTTKNEAHASFSPDGKSLILSSDRHGGFGGLDLYILKKTTDGEWGDPVNLGPVINTPEDETSAFLVEGGKILYFSSRGHFNMGGYDIFYSNRKTDDSWGETKNIGFPLNTTNDNDFFQPVKSGKTGYIALFGQKETDRVEEIYRIKILPLTEPATVTKSIFNDSFSIILSEEENGENITVKYDAASDTFTVVSPGGKSYRVKLLRKKD